MHTIYHYVDYREYLQDYFLSAKNKNYSFSYRAMAVKLGINSGTLTRILSGERGVSIKMIPQFVTALKFPEEEALYFELLISFDSEKSQQKRNRYYEQIMECRSKRKNVIEPHQYDYFSQWFYCVIRELLLVRKKLSAVEIQKHIVPTLSLEMVQATLETLCAIHLIEESGNGYSVINTMITTGESWKTAAICQLQKQMTKLGLESIDRFDKDERDISTLTVALHQETLPTVRNLLKRCREEILDLESKTEHPSHIYQLNCQLFPVTTDLSGDINDL